MNYVKTLGLSALVTAALFAFVGVGTASATVLCSTGEGSPTGTTCPAGKGYSGISVDAHAKTTIKLKYNNEWPLVAECSQSTLKFGTFAEGSATETVKGQIEALTLESCNCEVKTLTGGSLEVHWISGTHNGTLTSSGLLLTINCSNAFFGNVHCEYTTSSTDIGTITGGLLERIHINAPLSRLITNTFCGAEGKLEGEYERESPALLYVAGHT